ncbi:hypothetical protein SCARD494_03488 [Seiridium cardinale]
MAIECRLRRACMPEAEQFLGLADGAPGRRDPGTGVPRHTAYQAQKPGSFTVAALFCTLTGLTVRGPPSAVPRTNASCATGASPVGSVQSAWIVEKTRVWGLALDLPAEQSSAGLLFDATLEDTTSREDTRLARSSDVALRDEREVSRLPAMILRVQLASDERSFVSPASVA